MRTILISGASRGIGRAIAERAILDGHRLSLGVRDLNKINGSILDPKISGKEKLLINKYDVNNPDDAIKWVENSVKYYSEINTIVHCAGIFKKTSLNFSSGEEKDIDNLWKINVMGPWFLTKAAWKYLCKSNNPRIIVMVSMSGKRSKGKLAGYSTTKFALMGLCQTIRNEGWNEGIRITTICPSWVNTDMAKGISTINKEDMTQPQDIASIVSNLLELPDSCVPYDIPINCNLEY